MQGQVKQVLDQAQVEVLALDGEAAAANRGSGSSSGFTTSKSVNNSASPRIAPSQPSIGKSSGWGSSAANVNNNNSTTKPTTPNVNNTGTSWGSSSKIANSDGVSSYKPASATDKAMYQKAVQSGTAYSSKNDAIQNFQAKYADKYPSKFIREPAIRPSYIPTYTVYGGTRYNVIYNSSYGGYGYYDSTGLWIAYSVMRDTAMLNSLMYNQGYYYPGNPAYAGSPVIVQSPFSIMAFLGYLVVFVLFAFMIMVLYFRMV